MCRRLPYAGSDSTCVTVHGGKEELTPFSPVPLSASA